MPRHLPGGTKKMLKISMSLYPVGFWTQELSNTDLQIDNTVLVSIIRLFLTTFNQSHIPRICHHKWTCPFFQSFCRSRLRHPLTNNAVPLALTSVSIVPPAVGLTATDSTGSFLAYQILLCGFRLHQQASTSNEVWLSPARSKCLKSQYLRPSELYGIMGRQIESRQRHGCICISWLSQTNRDSNYHHCVGGAQMSGVIRKLKIF